MMRVVSKSSENEMIATFLKAEITSSRFNKDLIEVMNKFGATEEIIINPNLLNAKENSIRYCILSNYRGYGINAKIFSGFPKDINWQWVKLDVEDIKRIKYIEYDYWNELSNGSRLAKDTTENIKNNVEIFEVSNENFIKAANYLDNGGTFEPIIVMAPYENKGNMIVLEGHLRLTAMFLAKRLKPIKALVGYSNQKDLDKWYRY